MKQFMDDNFLLETETARRLYHEHAAKMPIIDYHCHINPQEIAEDKRYDSITEVWLGGDHYKWRAMRCNGVQEADITGSKDTDPYRTFEKWAETLPRAIGNPLYHWTYLELKKYFGITEPLNGKSAKAIYDKCNARLKDADMSVRGIIDQSNVKLICTTDDPVDSLEWHKKIKADPTCKVKVLPAFRPDKAFNIHKPEYASYMAKLAEVSGVEIKNFADVVKALYNRIDFFNEMGCRASDHALDYAVYADATEEELNAIVAKGLAGGAISAEELNKYKTACLLAVAKKYKEYGWVMQIHFGCIRDNNTAWYKKLGPDTGFDAVSNTHGADDLGKLMDAMAMTGDLPKMVLYSLNQYDNETIMTLAGAFQVDGQCASQIQMGSAWWFNDTKTGMEKQLTDFANLGVLGNFIGMLTDSRSFLSYTRHEYFRRILCNWIGNLVENGEYHADMETLGQLVEDISYNNTVKFFGFDV
ncbi:glucuronate isomerase [uncultured Ruthenibacterium sp.]|uniref:glucuronate isomerase n=1 Tax=uncultured Ruthenibacterium sp. TaxID=1905347 RepID=UPI00349E4A61